MLMAVGDKKKQLFRDTLQAWIGMLDGIKVTGRVGIGIDPGATGAIGILVEAPALVGVVDIPTYTHTVHRTRFARVKVKTKDGSVRRKRVKKSGPVNTTVFDLDKIAILFQVLRPLRKHAVVYLEHPPSTLGPGKAAAELKLREAWAMWPLFLRGTGWSFQEPRAFMWKKVCGLTGKKKKNSRDLVNEKWPDLGLTMAKDHDKAEALLLAELAMERNQACLVSR